MTRRWLVMLAFAPSVATAQTAEPQTLNLERFSMPLASGGILNVDPGHVTPGWGVTAHFGLVQNPMRLDGVAIVGPRLSGEMGAYAAVLPWLSVGVALPIVAWQRRDADRVAGVTLSPLRAGGLGAVRGDVRAQLLAGRVDIALGLSAALPTLEGSYLADDGLELTPWLGASGQLGAVRVAGNILAHTRPALAWANHEVDTSLEARIGVAAAVSRKVEALASATLAVGLNGDDVNANRELLGGVQWWGRNIGIFAAAGVGLSEAWGTPEWRVVVGTQMRRARQVSPDGDDDQCLDENEDIDGFEDDDGCPDVDNDDDGVADIADLAPLDAEDRDGVHDDDGAPEHDGDADGIADAADKCPLEPELINGVADADGCPDRDLDADGISDDQDQCATAPEDLDGFVDADGCPEENDADGIPDSDDACPNESGSAQARGCPDRDSDGDGVLDRLDNCPSTAGPAANNGCRTRQLVRLGETEIYLRPGLGFGVGQTTVSAGARAVVAQLAAVLVAHPEIRQVIIESHTDDSGIDGDQATTQARAEAIVAELVALGVDRPRLVPIGRGAEVPVRMGTTRQVRTGNRRIVVLTP